MRKVLLSVLALCSMGVASAQMASGVQARVYAYDLQQETTTKVVNEGTIASYVVTFKTNTVATSAVVNLKDANGEVVGNGVEATSNDGKNWTATVDVTTLGTEIVAGTYNWEVTVSAGAVENFTLISDNENSSAFAFWRSYNVAIDNSPESNHFGRIYVANYTDGTSTGYAGKNRTTSVGMYAFQPDLTAEKNAEAYNCSVIGRGEASASGVSPNDMVVATDGTLLLTDNSADYAGLYKVNPNNFNVTETGITNKLAGIGVLNNDGEDEIYAVDVTNGGAINKYEMGDWTNPTIFNKLTITSSGTEYSVAPINGYNSIAPTKDGFWVCQYNGNLSKASSMKAGTALFFCNTEGVCKWALGTHALSINGTNAWSLNARDGGITINEDLGLIAFSVVEGYATASTRKAFAYVFSYTLNSSGRPTPTIIGTYELTGQGNRTNSLAFDYAGNLYAVTSGTERLCVYALPTDNNTRTTPAKSALTIEITSDDITTGVDNIAIDANAPVEYYNLQGVKVENPTKGIFIKKQGAKATKVVL